MRALLPEAMARAATAHATAYPYRPWDFGDALLGYARVLQDDAPGLFVHGYDVGSRSSGTRSSTTSWRGGRLAR